MRVPVKGHPTLYKDTESGLIIQDSSHDRDRYRTARHNAMLQASLRDEVEHLKKDMYDMKNDIQSILKILTLNSK